MSLGLHTFTGKRKAGFFLRRQQREDGSHSRLPPTQPSRFRFLANRRRADGRPIANSSARDRPIQNSCVESIKAVVYLKPPEFLSSIL